MICLFDSGQLIWGRGFYLSDLEGLLVGFGGREVALAREGAWRRRETGK